MAGWVYDPPGPVGKAFLNSTAFVRGIMGPFGSGKSTVCVMDIIDHARRQKISDSTGLGATRWAVIRNTYPELRTTTMKTWHQWVPETLGRWQAEGPPTHTIKTTDMNLELIFVALDRPDDVKKLLSMELTGAWLNEVRETPKAILDGLTGRVGRFPAAIDGGCSWRGVIMDTNAMDMEHWYYKLAEEERPDEFEFFRQPSGLSAGAENLMWLDQDEYTVKYALDDPRRLAKGRAYYERLCKGKKDDWIKVYVHADYGYVSEGKPVYDNFYDNLHIAQHEFVPQWPLHIGMDFGLTPAAVFGQRTPMGQSRILSEVCATRLGATSFAIEIKEHVKQNYPGATLGNITGDPAGDAGGTDEDTVFKLMAAQGVIAYPAQTNDPAIRIEAVNSKMKSLIDGQPAMVIHPRCKQLRKACAGGYHYRRVKLSSELKFEEKPYKNMSSHVADALQYFELGLGGGREVVIRPQAAQASGLGLPSFAENVGVIQGWQR